MLDPDTIARIHRDIAAIERLGQRMPPAVLRVCSCLRLLLEDRAKMERQIADANAILLPLAQLAKM